MSTQSFQTITARARPHRVAVLVNIDEPHWQVTCLGVIQFLTKLWGGSQSVIVPTDGKKIAEEFWAVLSAHDPDIILCYRKAGNDLKQADPTEFQSTVQQWTEANLARSGMKEEDLKAHIEEQLFHQFIDNFVISDELSEQLVARLAPLHFDPAHTQNHKRQLNLTYIGRGSVPFYPLTSVLDVIPYAESSRVVADIVRDPSQEIPPELWIAAAMGSNDEKQTAALVEAKVTTRLFPSGELSSSQLVSLGLQPNVTLKTAIPWAHSMTALAYYRSIKSMRHQLPTVVMIGDTVSDFSMYYALRWLQGRALWLPKWFFEDAGSYTSRLATAIRGIVEIANYEHSQQLTLASFSISTAEMGEAEKRVIAATNRSSVVVESMEVKLVEPQLRHPSRCCTEGTIGDISTRMFVDGELPGFFETPRPLKINPLNAQQHRWMVDISFEKYQFPRHPAMGGHVVSNSNLLDVRAGKDAVAYACPGMMVMGTDMDNNLVRPQIRMPNCEKIFGIIFNDCGFESQVSDKGAYASQVCEKFGGLEEVGYSLRRGNRALLKKYLDTSQPKQGDHSDGTFLNDARRYLNFSAISKILGSDERAIQTIDSYVSKSILYRGFIFQCHRCADVSWFSISDISDTFTCRRCRTTQPYTKRSWRHPDEPAWFYKLDEIVYLTMLHNGDVPLLTLDYMRRLSGDSFLFCPELRIRPENSKKAFIEIDICCVSNGRLCIGEAKSNDSIATKELTALQIAERYCDLAVKMGASLVVFSTSESCWGEPTFSAISKAFASQPYIKTLTLGEGGLLDI